MRKGAYPRELKKFCIRYAHKAQTGYPVAGVVVVVDARGKGYTRIRFDEALVGAVGKAMPMGVSPEHPCYLKVLQVLGTERWRVFAYYLDAGRGVLLWEAGEKPAWVKNVRRDDNGKTQKAEGVEP
jgi:hypothetical protein